MMMLDPFLTLTAQFFLALLLFAAGLHKSANQGRLQAAISAYRVVPAHFEKPVAWLAMGVELIVGAALMVPVTAKSASLAAAGVFAAYFAVMALNMLRGNRQADCGCSFHRSTAPLGSAHLVRNGLLVLVAIVSSMPDAGRAVGWPDAVQITAAVACLALLYLSVDSLLAHVANGAGMEAR